MELNEQNIKKLSIIGARATFGQALLELAEKDEKLIVVNADVSTSAGLDRFRKKFPDQYIDVGIAEQNMMGIATGLASNGFHVVTTTFAPFQTMRCLEQIRVYQGYMNMPLVFVGLASGLYHSYLGNTHCSVEDIGVLRSIPNIAIECPSDCTTIVKSLEEAINYKTAVYIRLPESSPMPVVYNHDLDYSIAKANIIQNGKDIAILSHGISLHTALEVSKKLLEQNITATVIDFHTIKPIDKDCLDKISNYKTIVTIEEHNIIGGLSSAIAEYLIQKPNRNNVIICGIEDFYPHATDYNTALEQCGLTTNQIYNKIINSL